MHQLPIFPARKPARFPLRLLWKMFLLTKQWMHHPCQILCRSPVPIASSKLCSCSPDARIARMVTGGEIGRSACPTMLIAAAALRQDSWDTQRQVMRVSSRHWHELYKQPHLSFSEIELQIMATELFWILDMVRNWSWLVVWSIFYCPEILGMSSSQLLLTLHDFSARSTTNQIIINHH